MSGEFYRSSAAKGGQAFQAPGEQRLKVLQGLGRGQMSEQMREVGMGLDAVRLGGFGERKEAARRRGAGLAGREQEPLSCNDKWANCILANVVRKACLAMREKHLERVFCPTDPSCVLSARLPCHRAESRHQSPDHFVQ